MELKNGGLYETKHGKRFRVTLDAGFFTCSSFGGFWYADGEAAGKVTIAGKYRKPHLVREVDECRWVPASNATWLNHPVEHRSVKGKHQQIRVSREEARAMGQEGHDKAMLKRVAASVISPKPDESGEIQVTDCFGFRVGFNWKIKKDNGCATLDIETTSGVIISLPL